MFSVVFKIYVTNWVFLIRGNYLRSGKVFLCPSNVGVCLWSNNFVQLTREYIALCMCICGLLFFMVLHVQNFQNWNENLTNIQFYSLAQEQWVVV